MKTYVFACAILALLRAQLRQRDYLTAVEVKELEEALYEMDKLRILSMRGN